MAKRVANQDARRYVQNLEEFQGSNTFAVWKTVPGDVSRYVVYSYSQHWPLFIYEDGKWYENADKYSRTTSKHCSQLHPLCDTERRSASDMVDIALYGVAEWVQRKLRAA